MLDGHIFSLAFLIKCLFIMFNLKDLAGVNLSDFRMRLSFFVLGYLSVGFNPKHSLVGSCIDCHVKH